MPHAAFDPSVLEEQLRALLRLDPDAASMSIYLAHNGYCTIMLHSGREGVYRNSTGYGIKASFLALDLPIPAQEQI